MGAAGIDWCIRTFRNCDVTRFEIQTGDRHSSMVYWDKNKRETWAGQLSDISHSDESTFNLLRNLLFLYLLARSMFPPSWKFEGKPNSIQPQWIFVLFFVFLEEIIVFEGVFVFEGSSVFAFYTLYVSWRVALRLYCLAVVIGLSVLPSVSAVRAKLSIPERVMEKILFGIEGVRISVDDVIIHAETTAELVKRVRNVFNRSRE